LAQTQKAEQAAQFAEQLQISHVYSETCDFCFAALGERLQLRAAALERAQVLASTAADPATRESQLNLVRMLQGTQGVSWALGYHGLAKFVDLRDLQFRANYAPLAAYSKPRLLNNGVPLLQPPPEPASAPRLPEVITTPIVPLPPNKVN
jgi:hypothetical protein